MLMLDQSKSSSEVHNNQPIRIPIPGLILILDLTLTLTYFKVELFYIHKYLGS